jgi:hypothetical protein
MRIERTTSPLPRECSTTELQEPTDSFSREIAAFHVSLCTNSYTSSPLTLHFPHQNGPELTRWFFTHHTALQLQNFGAGERDRTVVCSLEGCRSTIELLPPLAHDVRHGTYHHISHHPKTGGESWIRTSVLVRGQIYSLLPLTTRPSLHGNPTLSRLSPETSTCSPCLRTNAALHLPDASYETKMPVTR